MVISSALITLPEFCKSPRTTENSRLISVGPFIVLILPTLPWKGSLKRDLSLSLSFSQRCLPVGEGVVTIVGADVGGGVLQV